jgi:hypothetical protein
MTMSKRFRLAISLAPLLAALGFAIPAVAAPHGGSERHFDGGGRGDFHRDGGHFRHDHDRFGFGFGFGGGFWDPWWGWGPADYWGYPYSYPYYYPAYPAYYAPPAGYAPQPGYAPPPGSTPETSTQAMGAPPPQYWYYCDNPQGYYPYVQNCGAAWRQVAATPPSGSGNTITPKQKP